MSNHQGAQQLWQRVVLQALRDAIAARSLDDIRTYHARRDAVDWLDDAGPDFRTVCSLAGFDPEMVRDWWIAINKDAAAMSVAASRFHDATRLKGAEDHGRYKRIRETKARSRHQRGDASD